MDRDRLPGGGGLGADRRKVAAPVRKHFTTLPERHKCFQEVDSLHGHDSSRHYTGGFSYRSIVTGEDVQARLATADTANSVLALPAGSEIKILSTRGDWMYAALPNDLRGWIQTRNAEQVRL